MYILKRGELLWQTIQTHAIPITQADIERYSNMLDKGEDGIWRFYRDLESKGYHSAGWSLNQYDIKPHMVQIIA